MNIDTRVLRPFKGRSAVVTGAGRGIGKAIAVALADAGARVGVLARTQVEIDATVRMITERGGSAYAIHVDVADQQSIMEAVSRIYDHVDSVDMLINNAGVVGPIGSSVEVDFNTWTDSIKINLIGVAQLTFLLLPPMLSEQNGSVVNVLSGTAKSMSAMVGANAYATSKSALEVFTLNLASEHVGSGVNINAYRPGPVDTAMQQEMREQHTAQIGSAAPLQERFLRSYESGRLIKPEDSAAVLLTRLQTDAHGEVWNFRD